MTNSTLKPTSNVKIDKWEIGAKKVGCYEYCNLYYFNMVDGNTERPDKGLGSGSYKGGFDFCGLVAFIAANAEQTSTCTVAKPTYKIKKALHKQAEAINDNKKDIHANEIDIATLKIEVDDLQEDFSQAMEYMNKFMDFLNGIDEFVDGEENGPYALNDWVLYNGALYQSLKDNNKRHPDDKESWREYGNINNVLTRLFDEETGCSLKLPCWENCGADCYRVFGKGACAIEKQAALKENGDPLLDSHGNQVYDSMIYMSLIDNNVDKPSIGAVKNPPTWDGPYTLCEYLNRPIGVNQDGDTLVLGGENCFIDCDAPIEPLGWVDVPNPDCNTCDKPLLKKLTVFVSKGLEIVNGFIQAKLGKGLIFDPNDAITLNLAEGLEFDVNDALKAKIAEGLIFDANGNIIVKAADDSIIVDANGIRVNRLGVDIVKAADDSIIVDANGIRVNRLGVDRNGAPVMAGDCLVTCATDLHVVAIDNTGMNTILTLSDGSTVVGPETDNDDFVKTVVNVTNADNSNTITLTMQSGIVHTLTIPAPPTAIPLTWDFLVDPDTGLVSMTINGVTKTVDIDMNTIWPSASGRIGNTGLINGEVPPNVGAGTTNEHLDGGFAYDANGRLVIPKTGRYWYEYDVTAWVGKYPNPLPGFQADNRVTFTPYVNYGLATERKLKARDFENWAGASTLDTQLTRDRFAYEYLDKGDTITFVISGADNNHWLTAYTYAFGYKSGPKNN